MSPVTPMSCAGYDDLKRGAGVGMACIENVPRLARPRVLEPTRTHIWPDSAVYDPVKIKEVEYRSDDTIVAAPWAISVHSEFLTCTIMSCDEYGKLNLGTFVSVTMTRRSSPSKMDCGE